MHHDRSNFYSIIRLSLWAIVPAFPPHSFSHRLPAHPLRVPISCRAIFIGLRYLLTRIRIAQFGIRLDRANERTRSYEKYVTVRLDQLLMSREYSEENYIYNIASSSSSHTRDTTKRERHTVCLLSLTLAYKQRTCPDASVMSLR